MIPNLVHFCFGMTPDFGGRPFSLIHYLSIRSAWEILQPECMILHCAYEPTGEWWELAKPMLRVHQVNPVTGIYGFPAAHPAHRADIVRLAALIAMGGIYLDTDVLVVRPFSKLMGEEFVAAREVTADGTQVGLSNAILLTQPESQFARLCLEGHDPRHSLWQGFRSRGRDENYVEYSVRYPCLLADLCPGTLRTLPSQSFLWATWDDAGLKSLFEKDTTVPQEVLAIHLWESHAWAKYLSKLTGSDIQSRDSTFNKLARRFLPGNCRNAGRQASSAPDYAALSRMDEICRDADFVSPEHLFPAGVVDKTKFWIRQTLRHLRSEIMLPLRYQLDEIANRSERHLEGHGPRPFDGEFATESSGQPILRFGPLDGSLELLEALLEGNQQGPVRFAIYTGAGTEPGVCGWLAAKPNFQGVWATTSLSRARQLAEWSLATGSQIRCIHAEATGEQFTPGPEISLENLTVLVLAGTGFEAGLWRKWQAGSPKIVLVACNPALDPNSRSSATDWGASRADMIEIAGERDYDLITESSDGQFLLFMTTWNEEVINRPIQRECFRRVKTLYGQVIHLPK